MYQPTKSLNSWVAYILCDLLRIQREDNMKFEKLGKAEKAIYTAFYELRMKYPIYKVKVVDICSTANVNKSTFYDHFQDVYDVSTKLELFLIDDAYKDFDKVNLIFYNPSEFIKEFKNCFVKYHEELSVLAKGREKELLYNIESEIYTLFDNDLDSLDKQFVMTFILGGSIHVIERFDFLNKDFDAKKEFDSKFEKLATQLLKNYGNEKSA